MYNEVSGCTSNSQWLETVEEPKLRLLYTKYVVEKTTSNSNFFYEYKNNKNREYIEGRKKVVTDLE